jgi:hypothetical protein
VVATFGVALGVNTLQRLVSSFTSTLNRADAPLSFRELVCQQLIEVVS